jgi:lipoyl-dependent peroxiredoxin
MIVHGSASWLGNFHEGTGTISTGSDTLNNSPYSYASRFEGAPGANPEELLAAAYAGCLNHALANITSLAGHRVVSIDTTAEVITGRDERGPAVLAIHLSTRADIAEVDDVLFQDLAVRAQAGCALSKIMTVPVTLTATRIHIPD